MPAYCMLLECMMKIASVVPGAWCLVPFVFQRKNFMSYCTLFHQHHKSVVKCTLSQKIISLIVT